MRLAVFNGIAIGEFTVSFLSGPTPKFNAKAAFINTLTGKTHGWTTSQQWSKETYEKLAELRVLMEGDIASMHFADADNGEHSTTAVVGGSLAESKSKVGIGEALGSAEEPPQV